MKANGKASWSGDWPTVRYFLCNRKYDGRLRQTFDGHTVEAEAKAFQIVEK